MGSLQLTVSFALSSSSHLRAGPSWALLISSQATGLGGGSRQTLFFPALPVLFPLAGGNQSPFSHCGRLLPSLTCFSV